MQANKGDVRITASRGGTGMLILSYYPKGSGLHIGFHRHDEIIMTLPAQEGILELYRVL